MRSDLTKTEVLLFRQLITDRREDRFRRAGKAAGEMNLNLLRSCVDEIERLEGLKGKMNAEG